MFVVAGIVVPGCGESRASDEELLAKHPDGSIYLDSESAPPGRGRGLPDVLRAQADVIGRGVGVAVGERRSDGSRIAPREGLWTYEYVRTTHTIQPDGTTMTHFPELEKGSLGLEARGEYVHGKLQGEWTYWHPNGKKRANGRFVDDAMTGPWQFWLENGEPDRVNSGTYDKNVRVGP
jgi:hypothetical protein